MPSLVRRRAVRPLSERLFRVKRMGYLKRNLEVGKEEYAAAAREIAANTQRLQQLKSVRATFLGNTRVDSHSRAKLNEMNNIIAGLEEMIQVATRTKQRAREMVEHAKKKLGISSAAQRAKRAA